MAKHITIFTSTTCASCAMVKHFLKLKGQTYEEVNVDEDPSRQAEARQFSGTNTVPVTVVTKQDDSREVIVGYNLAQLVPALSA